MGRKSRYGFRQYRHFPPRVVDRLMRFEMQAHINTAAMQMMEDRLHAAKVALATKLRGIDPASPEGDYTVARMPLADYLEHMQSVIVPRVLTPHMGHAGDAAIDDDGSMQNAWGSMLDSRPVFDIDAVVVVLVTTRRGTGA